MKREWSRTYLIAGLILLLIAWLLIQIGPAHG
jgi:glucose dehydrogenase